eukprot:scaffold21290_cov156-Skeletonema_marinoi.AAC.10
MDNNNSIVSLSPSAAVHETQREEEHPSQLHRLVSSSTNSATSLLSPFCMETSSSPPILVTPPRSSSKINQNSPSKTHYGYPHLCGSSLRSAAMFECDNSITKIMIVLHADLSSVERTYRAPHYIIEL